MFAESKTTVVDLLRHGQPDNDGCLNGHYDAVLTDKGWRQLRQAMQHPCDYRKIITSPLLRCQAFAEEYSEQHSLPLLIDADWQEMSFGLWDGKPYTWIHEHYPEALSAFWRDPWQFPPEAGETMRTFYHRIISAWQQLLTVNAGDRILLVSHSGVIRQLLSFILGMDPEKNLSMSRFHIPYGSLTRIEIYHDEFGDQWPKLIFVNGQVAI